MSPFIFLDSSDPSITYGSAWAGGNDPQVAGGSYNACRTDVNALDVTSPTKMSFSFTGAAIEFFGQPSNNLQMNYTFDDTRSRKADLTFEKGTTGKTGISLYKVGNFTPGYHTMSLIPTAGQPIFDYAIITPTATQGLNKDTLILDDTDSIIHYNTNGRWSRESGTLFSSGRSYNDTRVGTDKVGDTFTIHFFGDSIGVYGLVNHQLGSVSSSYSVDGGDSDGFTYSYSSTAADGDWALHQKFFYKEFVPGNHTLEVTVTEITGSQKFWLDYVTFEGTVSTTLADPSIPPSSSSSAHKGFNWTGLIAGVIVSGIVLCFLWACCKQTVRRKIAGFMDKMGNPAPPREDLEVPRPPMLLRRPPHLQSAPPYEPPTAPPPMSMPIPSVAHLNHSYPPTPLPSSPLPPSPSPSPSEPLLGHPSYMSPPVPPPVALAPPPVRPSREPSPEVSDMQREINRLREENERIRAQAQAQTQTQTRNQRQNTAESDAGPADSPPPYNDSNYIS